MGTESNRARQTDAHTLIGYLSLIEGIDCPSALPLTRTTYTLGFDDRSATQRR